MRRVFSRSMNDPFGLIEICFLRMPPRGSLMIVFLQKENPSSFELEGFMMEPLVRFELTTVRLQGGCSTTELKRHDK